MDIERYKEDLRFFDVKSEEVFSYILSEVINYLDIYLNLKHKYFCYFLELIGYIKEICKSYYSNV